MRRMPPSVPDPLFRMLSDQNNICFLDLIKNQTKVTQMECNTPRRTLNTRRQPEWMCGIKHVSTAMIIFRPFVLGSEYCLLNRTFRKEFEVFLLYLSLSSNRALSSVCFSWGYINERNVITSTTIKHYCICSTYLSLTHFYIFLTTIARRQARFHWQHSKHMIQHQKALPACLCFSPLLRTCADVIPSPIYIYIYCQYKWKIPDITWF